jgi:hypothetical protein
MTGYQSKKAAAQAKVEGPVHVVCQCDKCKAQPAQEPKSVTYKEVADTMNALRKGNFSQQAVAKEVGELKLYTTPPQRTWVGLTDEEIDALHMAVKVRLMGTFNTKDIYRVIEDKLKEKNT